MYSTESVDFIIAAITTVSALFIFFYYFICLYVRSIFQYISRRIDCGLYNIFRICTFQILSISHFTVHTQLCHSTIENISKILDF